ncbi:MAG TPA: nitroreductase [Actinobacteria bacterium]|nr:nitroreductase [Actinomycetota bacterium]
MVDRCYERILRLRAIRTYRPEPLADEDLVAVLEAARWTGSAKNRQDWAVVVVTDPAQRARLAACGNFTEPIRNAPVTLALVQEPGGYEFDVGRMAQNIMLAADALGIASCPVTLHHDDRAHEVLGLPDGSRCRYAVALGYPAEDAAPARWGGRKPLVELVHHDRYGVPWPPATTASDGPARG